MAADLLFGDPRFNPNQSAVDAKIGYNSALSGIYQWVNKTMRNVPTDLVARTRSYCIKHDPVCNYSKANLASCAAATSSCPHLLYVTAEWPSKAATWAAQVWHSLGG